MTESLKSIQDLQRLNATSSYIEGAIESGRCHAPAIKKWKQDGKKVIAFQCAYVPEEIIHAAGMLPVRLYGTETKELDLDDASAEMYQNTCSFIRSCLQLVMTKHWSFLDGFVAGATCDPSRRLWDIWDQKKYTPFVQIISVPRKYDELAHERFAVEMKNFRSHLEEFFDIQITDQAIWDSIKIYNRTRELFRELYELKKKDEPPITGAETQGIYNAMHKLPREDFNSILEKIVDEAKDRKIDSKGKVRLLLNGSPLHNAGFIKFIEDLGGIVVVDELCTGSRYWWDSVDTQTWDDPIIALSRRYLGNQPCARMIPSDERFRRVANMAKDWRIDGMISEIIHYCVPYAHDQPFLREKMAALQIPTLELELDYGEPGSGPIRTRVQAFFEMLEGKRNERLSN